ncbi:MAG: SOS response-associated peptidase [Hyphomonadaceae bacterium]
MCNEYKLRFIDGEWRWVHVSRAKRPIPGPQGSFNFDAVREAASDAREIVYHVFPDRIAPVIRKNKAGEIEMVDMRWGFPPVEPGARPVVNARSLTSPYWKPWLGPQWRALVPVSEFCEWTDTAPKQRRWFRLKDDEAFCFAALWRPWTGTRGTKSNPVSGEHLLFTILTTEANDVVRPIHAKAMPLILPRREWMNWLEAPEEAVFAIQRGGFPAEDMAEPALEPLIPEE